MLKSNLSTLCYGTSIRKIIIGLLFIWSVKSTYAQTSCDHLTLDYNVSQWYYALGVNNTTLEESEFLIEILGASYLLDGSQFSNSNGIQLTVETTMNEDATYDHILTPDQAIGAYRSLLYF